MVKIRSTAVCYQGSHVTKWCVHVLVIFWSLQRHHRWLALNFQKEAHPCARPRWKCGVRYIVIMIDYGEKKKTASYHRTKKTSPATHSRRLSFSSVSSLHALGGDSKVRWKWRTHVLMYNHEACPSHAKAKHATLPHSTLPQRMKKYLPNKIKINAACLPANPYLPQPQNEKFWTSKDGHLRLA